MRFVNRVYGILWDPEYDPASVSIEPLGFSCPQPGLCASPVQCAGHSSLNDVSDEMSGEAAIVPDHPTYKNDTCEELLDLSRANAQAVIISTAAFLEESGVPVDAWVAYLGSVFAQSWDSSLDLSAGDFLDAMLTNYRSLGADVLSATLGKSHAEATITGFPKKELCLELGLDCSPAESYFSLPSALAETHGLRWIWTITGPRVKLEVIENDAD